MTEFEPSHSLISRIFSLFEFGKLSVPHRFWKWGALFLALVYAFTSMAYRIKSLILHYHNKSKSLLAATEPLLPSFDDDFCSDDEESDDVCSSSDGEAEDEEPISSSEDLNRFDEDFRVKGNFGESTLRKRKFKIRRRRSIGDDFSLSDLVNGNGVVKLWDSSFLGEFPAVSTSPAVIFSAGAGNDGVLGLGLWDFRTSRRKPAVQAEWQSDGRGRVVGIDGGRSGEVYVRDDARRMAVGDVRKLNTPLENSTASEEDTWWDADGVTDESSQ